MDHPTQRLDPHDPALPYNGLTRQLAGSLHERSQICPKCGDHMIWAKSVATKSGQNYGWREEPLYMAQLHQPIDREARYQICVALVCTACGYTELYTHNPQELIEQP